MTILIAEAKFTDVVFAKSLKEARRKARGLPAITGGLYKVDWITKGPHSEFDYNVGLVLREKYMRMMRKSMSTTNKIVRDIL